MSDRRNTNCSQIDMDLDILPNAAGIIATPILGMLTTPPPPPDNVVLLYLLLFYIMVSMVHAAADFHCTQCSPSIA